MRLSAYTALLLAALTLWGAEGFRKISLDEARRQALAHNYEVLALRRTRGEAEARLDRSRSAYYPRLGVAGGYDTQIARTGDQGGPVGYLYGNWNLFNGFQDSLRRQVAALEAEKAEIRLKQAEHLVGLDVEQAFHDYVFHRTALELKREAIGLNETHKRTAAQKRSAGLSGDADLIEFDLRDATLRSDVLRLEQKLEEARANLRRLLGEEGESGTRLEPVGVLQHQHLAGGAADLMKRVREKSQAVRLAERDLAVSSAETRLWLSRWLPRIDLQALVGYPPLDERQFGNAAVVGASLVARFELFSGFDAVGERRELETRRLRDEDLEQKNLERANRYYRAVLSEYRRGIKNSADVRVAAEGLFEAHLRREEFKYDFLVQRIALERVLGEPVPVVNHPEKGHSDHPGHRK